MKKKLLTVMSALLLGVLLLTALCGCSTYGKVLRAYKNEGYEETEIAEEYKDNVRSMFGDDYENILTVHVLTKKDGFMTTAVVIAEFNSTKELNEQMEKHITKDDAKEIAELIQELPNVSGNCVYVIQFGLDNALEIFQSTK